MLPPFDASGRLPIGTHEVEWPEVTERFGGTPRRRWLLSGLAEGLRLLCAAGCKAVYLGGSFVTAKPAPEDFDAAWDTTGVDEDQLDAVFFDFADDRAAQKSRFGGEFFPAQFTEGMSGRPFVQFFQLTRDGVAVGIVVIIKLHTVL